MKKLIITILAILVCVFVGDRLVGMAMWHINRNSKDTTAPKLKYLSSEIDDDIVIMGTSRCNNHYIPSIVEDSVGMNCYNGGIDGSENIYAQYFLLNIMLKKHKPKVICLDVMESYYAQDAEPFKTLTFFAPYIGIDQEADKLFKLAGTYNLYQISHIMRYNAKAVSNIIGCVYSPHAASEKGYLPTPKPPKYPEKFQVLRRQKIDPLKMEYMQKFIDRCKEEGIELVLSVSPMYDRVNGDYYEPLNELAQRNGIKVMDYHTPGLYSNKPEYFKDNRHLWSKGAQEFSKRFAHDLKQHLDTCDQESLKTGHHQK